MRFVSSSGNQADVKFTRKDDRIAVDIGWLRMSSEADRDEFDRWFETYTNGKIELSVMEEDDHQRALGMQAYLGGPRN